MKQSNATQQAVVERAVAQRVSAAGNVHAAYIGLDVHKVSISVAIAEIGRQAPEFRGEIPNEPKAIDKLVRQLSERFAGQPCCSVTRPALWLWDLSPGPGQRP
ncbi:hypothetical protein HAALTHF_29150n [Vreelandella aquamarina]|nr:hypothetical protein HAALTHF_29150n [Halomonas axialensis]